MIGFVSALVSLKPNMSQPEDPLTTAIPRVKNGLRVRNLTLAILSFVCVFWHYEKNEEMQWTEQKLKSILNHNKIQIQIHVQSHFLTTGALSCINPSHCCIYIGSWDCCTIRFIVIVALHRLMGPSPPFRLFFCRLILPSQNVDIPQSDPFGF